MLSESQARQFAHGWVQAWNSNDLDAIMSYYAFEVVLTSPTAANLLNDPSGTVAGQAAPRKYFERGRAAYPDLNFDLLDVSRGASSVVLDYVNKRATTTAAVMVPDANQKVVRVGANYA